MGLAPEVAQNRQELHVQVLTIERTADRCSHNFAPTRKEPEMFNAENNAEPVLSIGAFRTSREFRRLGILVEDGSSSMTEAGPGNMTKAHAVDFATRELLTRVKVSRKVKNFDFAVVTYDGEASVHTGPTPAETIDDDASYDPTVGHGGGTDIGAGLEKAREMAEAFLAQAPAGGVPNGVVIVVMSDGECGNPGNTWQVAASIKSGPHGSRITICSALFAGVGEPNPVAEGLLREISTDPFHFRTSCDASALRRFLAV